MKIRNNWKVMVNHTPEIIDRVIMPVRKRGIGVQKLSYEQTGDKGICEIQFEVDEFDAERIFKNMLRITDILQIEKIYKS